MRAWPPASCASERLGQQGHLVLLNALQADARPVVQPQLRSQPLSFHCACTPPAAWLGSIPPTPPRLAPPRSPVRYCRKVDRRAMTFPDPVEGMEHLLVDNNGVK